MLLHTKIVLLLGSIFLIASENFAQNNSILINEFRGSGKIEVSTFYGMKTKKIGEITSKSNTLKLTEKYIGFIRLSYNSYYEDFIFNNENIIITTKINSDSTISFHSDSKQNKMLNELKSGYIGFNNNIKNESDSTLQKYLITKRDKFTDSLLNLDTSSFFSKSTRYALMPLANKTPEEIIDLIPLTQNELLHCSIIPKMILSSFRSIHKPDDEILKQLLSNLYSKKFDPEIKDMTTTFLIEFFVETHSDKILDYFINEVINQNYCSGELSENSTKIIQQIELYQINNTLPEAFINGKSILKIIKKYKKQKIAIILWSIDCSHCMDMLKNLNTRKDPSMIYIGIELSANSKLEVIEGLDISLKEKNGWKSEVVEKWFINKTPTIFIIDNKLKILSVPEFI